MRRKLLCFTITLALVFAGLPLLATPVQAATTFTFPGGTLTTADTNSWGGYSSQSYGVHFNIDAGPLTVEYLGVNAYPINYTGDFGWPPDSTDTGASAIVGVGDGTNIAQYSLKSNMSGNWPRIADPLTKGKGSWNQQTVGHWNDDGYRSYLFQGQFTDNWVSTVGNSQYNAEKHGGPTGTNPDYDTFDIKMFVEMVGANTYKVTGWHRLWKSSARDEGCPWDWNYAKNAISPLKRDYLKCFEGTWTADGGLDLSNVQVFLAIQNWQGVQPQLYSFDWDSVVVTGELAPLIIDASASPGGSIAPAGSVTVNYGDNQTFTIAPNTGYYIADVLVDGSSVGAVTSYTFTNVTENHTIAASFARSLGKATGGVKFMASGVEVQLEFDAIATVDGVKGNVKYSNSSGVTFFGKVDGYYQEDNKAVIVGTIVKGTVTGFFYIAVQDNGEGKAAPPDAVLRVLAGPTPYILSLDGVGYYPIDKGNIQIHKSK